MAPKTGSKKPVETWRPERDLDCSLPKLTKFPCGSNQPVAEVLALFAPANIDPPIFVASGAKHSHLAYVEALYHADTSELHYPR